MKTVELATEFDGLIERVIAAGNAVVDLQVLRNLIIRVNCSMIDHSACCTLTLTLECGTQLLLLLCGFIFVYFCVMDRIG